MYRVLASNKSHLFAATVTSLCYSRYIADYNHADAFLVTYENGLLTTYLKADNFNERIKRAQALIEQETTLAFYIAECETIKNLYKIFYSALQKEDFTGKTSLELAALFRTLLHLQARCASLYQGTDEYGVKSLEEYLKIEAKQFADDWRAVFQSLAIATSPEMAEEEQAFVELQKQAQPDLLGFIKTYPWVCAKAFFFDEAVAELSQLMGVRSAKINTSPYEPILEINLQELLKNPKLARAASILQQFGRLRIELKARLSSKLLGSPLYTEIARRLDVPTKELFLTYDADEILLGLMSGKISREIGPRVYRGNGNNYEVIYGEAAKDYLTQLKKETAPTELSGLSVSRGLVRGIARIIIPARMSELVKNTSLQNGDILITTMTNPNMVFLMNKAGGIVTNEGGITCHAAIISREMKKPCIVGTRHATTVLKDGDLVEVDADKGTVKILERAK